ncbi:FAD synthetase [Bradyrhizobium quebecense]|uniref:FAD synthetase n=1 Tax=Bradyrhizobium quebecense TaxID=2748629 RepID=UPI001CD70399|nr:FAD synthetase [Bradyrhizobium quebecense]UGA46073.1 FAD synthetase [Bradyrhizobium quebecense]
MGKDLGKGLGRGFDSAAVAFHRDGELALDACVVTIGAFDGVHRGHQELLRQTIAAAQRRGVPAVVYTFDPPPKVYFGQAEALISLREKLERIATFAPDHVVVADFNEIYVRRSAADFLAELQRLQPREVIVGEDFRFGSCKGGTAQLLRQHFDTRILPPVRCGNGEIVSSSRIRSLRRSGLAAAASALENWRDIVTASPANRSSLAQLEVINP